MHSQRGFTLVELLVVISVIAVLSSIILAALASAKARGQDANIKRESLQIRNVFELQRTASGYTATYTLFTGLLFYSPGLSPVVQYYQPGDVSNCATFGDNSIVQEYTAILNGGGLLSIGEPVSDWANHTMYSIAAFLPGSRKYFCVGSSGQTSNESTDSTSSPGCLNNP